MSDRKILSHAIVPFTRYGIKINEALWLDGMPYFTSKAIAEWLELKAGQHNVRRIVDRNPYILEHTKVIDVIIESNYPAGIDENDQEDKGVKLTPQSLNGENKKDAGVNLTPACNENSQENHTTIKRTMTTKMRIFSPVGLQLVAMESNTAKAKEYKVLVATMVWKLMQGKIKELSPEQIEAEQLLKAWLKIKPGKCRRHAQAEKYMKLTGCSVATAYRHFEMVKKGENPFDKKWRNNVNYLKKYGYENQIRQLLLADPYRSAKNIWREIGSPKIPSFGAIKRNVAKLKNEMLLR